MNSLLLSMPGTPVIYYGDEIGMGDNIHLGDRNGVRTPMQWSPDRNGGFSRADPAALVLPPIMDPLYGYGAVNVEAQTRDPHSLLNWMRRMLAVRRRHPAFGRGTLTSSIRRTARFSLICANIEDETCFASPMSRTARRRSNSICRIRRPRSGRAQCRHAVSRRSANLPICSPCRPTAFTGLRWRGERLAGWHTPAPEPLPEFVTLVIRESLDEALLRQRARCNRTRGFAAIYRQAPLVRLKDERIESTRIARLIDIGDGAGEFCSARSK